MSDDIVKRLRATPNWLKESYGSWKDCTSSYDRAPFEAADEIERLRAIIASDGFLSKLLVAIKVRK